MQGWGAGLGKNWDDIVLRQKNPLLWAFKKWSIYIGSVVLRQYHSTSTRLSTCTVLAPLRNTGLFFLSTFFPIIMGKKGFRTST